VMTHDDTRLTLITDPHHLATMRDEVTALIYRGRVFFAVSSLLSRLKEDTRAVLSHTFVQHVSPNVFLCTSFDKTVYSKDCALSNTIPPLTSPMSLKEGLEV
jgi:hypothetical protein